MVPELIPATLVAQFCTGGDAGRVRTCCKLQRVAVAPGLQHCVAGEKTARAASHIIPPPKTRGMFLSAAPSGTSLAPPPIHRGVMLPPPMPPFLPASFDRP